MEKSKLFRESLSRLRDERLSSAFPIFPITWWVPGILWLKEMAITWKIILPSCLARDSKREWKHPEETPQLWTERKSRDSCQKGKRKGHDSGVAGIRYSLLSSLALHSSSETMNGFLWTFSLSEADGEEHLPFLSHLPILTLFTLNGLCFFNVYSTLFPWQRKDQQHQDRTNIRHTHSICFLSLDVSFFCREGKRT